MCWKSCTGQPAAAESDVDMEEIKRDEAAAAKAVPAACSGRTGEQAKERIAELYERIASVLSRQELEIFHLSVSGLSYEEIAKRQGISVKSVDNAIQRARRKLRSVRNLTADSDADSCAEPQ